jgi:hypothetical protein
MPSITEIPSTPQPAGTSPRPSDGPSRMIRDHPMTPQSPVEKMAVTVATDQDQDQAQSPIANSSNTESNSAHNKAPGVAIAAPKSSSATSATSILQSIPGSAAVAHSILSSPVPTTSRDQSSWWSKIVLTLQNSDGAFDLDNEAFGDCLRDTDLSAFFKFFSQRSRVPLTKLDWLTLTMKFGVRPSQVQVINKMGGEEEWRVLKTKIEKLFEFVRDKYPQETKFYIWIEIGK